MIKQLLEQGLRRHHAGQLDEAKRLYEQALAMRPQHPDALNLLGVLALQTAEPERAARLIEQAICGQPGNPGFHANLAQAYLAQQRIAEAHAAFRRAATLDPDNPHFAVGAASCLALRGNLAEAEQQLRAVVRRHPDFALAWFNLGHTVRDQSRCEEAAGIYRHTIELDPAFADAHGGLGSVLHALERFEEAERAYRQHLVLQPDSVAGHCNLASLLIDRGRLAEAVTACRKALERAPASAELHLMLGSALAHQGRFTAALGAFRAAANIAPENARALWGCGLASLETGAIEPGLASLRRALELQPESADFRYGMAGIHLALGDFQAGWAEHEWRTARREFVAENPGTELAVELPDDLSGSRILLLREQGLGDQLFFLRFAAALKSRGAQVTHQAHGKLASILARVPVLDRVIAQDDPLPAADHVLLVGDLPHALGRFPASPFPPRTAARRRRPDAAGRKMRFPAVRPVFFPEPAPALALSPLPEQLEQIKRRLAALGPPPYLGVTWRAGTAPERQRGKAWGWFKEIALEPLAATLRGINGTVLALQRNPQSGEIDQLADLAGEPVRDLTALNEDLEAMLALLALVDEYVGVSNTNMHLRAGVGKTARVLATRPHEWRWMIAGEASPWFPGFRVYRQGADGDWGAALSRLALELRSAGERAPI